ncbi:MAG: primosome assembly protein PriA, partial [bacterium]|nr:primosome assembly protein PriA [bacterium]
IQGDPEALREVGRAASARVDCEMLGPSGESLLLRVPRAEGRRLTTALRDIQAERSAKKEAPVRVQIDPPDL